MRRPVCASLAALCLVVAAPWSSLAAPPEASIDASVAGLFIGEQKLVEGQVVTAQRDGNIVRLHLGTAAQDLSVSLVVGLLSKFPPDPEGYYVGKTIQVTGTIRGFRGAPEMTIHDPTDIHILAAARPPTTSQPVAAPAPSVTAPAAVAPAESPAAEERIDALDQRVRRLERRVRQLEHAGARGGRH